MAASQGKAVVPNQLSDAYEGLVAKLGEAGEDAGCGPLYHSRPPKGAFASGSADNEAKFECTFYLKGWKWRASSRSTAAVDILVKALETIHVRPLRLVSSSIHVSYFETDGQKARLRGCIHYDHTNPPQDDQHPFFHAQLYGDPVAPEGEVKDHFVYALVEPSCFHPFNHIRIPTADMTFSSVLLCLAADHLPEAFFKEFQQRFTDLQDRLPHPAIDDFRWSFGLGANAQRPTHLKSSHWFTRKPK